MADIFSKTRDGHICPGGIRCRCAGGRKERVRHTRNTRARIAAGDHRQHGRYIGRRDARLED